jgi:hypothetical protein
VWAATRPPEPVPFDADDMLASGTGSPTRPLSAAFPGADPAADGSAGEAGSKPATPSDAYAAAAMFGALTERDAPRRAPCLAARGVHEVEQLILRSSRKGRLRTCVVCPGLMYGQGEDDEGLHPIMRAAWEVRLHVRCLIRHRRMMAAVRSGTAADSRQVCSKQLWVLLRLYSPVQLCS